MFLARVCRAVDVERVLDVSDQGYLSVCVCYINNENVLFDQGLNANNIVINRYLPARRSGAIYFLSQVKHKHLKCQ